MTIVIYDYKEDRNDVVLKEVQSIKDIDKDYLAVFFECGEYTSIAKDEYNHIKIM